MRPCFVYFLVKGKKVVYIGISYNLVTRTMEHAMNKEFSSIRWVQCESRDTALKYERRWILKFMPILNKESFLKKAIQGMKRNPYLTDSSLEWLKDISENTGIPMDELLKHPLAKSFYSYR